MLLIVFQHERFVISSILLRKDYNKFNRQEIML